MSAPGADPGSRLLHDGDLVAVCETTEEADARGLEAAESDYVVFLIGKQRLRHSDAA